MGIPLQNIKWLCQTIKTFSKSFLVSIFSNFFAFSWQLLSSINLHLKIPWPSSIFQRHSHIPQGNISTRRTRNVFSWEPINQYKCINIEVNHNYQFSVSLDQKRQRENILRFLFVTSIEDSPPFHWKAKWNNEKPFTELQKTDKQALKFQPTEK